MLTTVLFPHDGSPLADRALPFATAMVRAARGRLILLRVGAPLGWSHEPLDDRDIMAELDALAQKIRAGDLPVETYVQHGYYDEVGQAIVEAARERQAGLIVMSTHGRGGLGRWLYGSAADQVLRLTTVPVLLVPAACERPWPDDRPLRTLVPLDGSDLGLAILNPVQELGELLHTVVLLVRVFEPPLRQRYAESTSDGPGLEAEIDAAREDLEAVAGRLRAGGRTVEVHLSVGDAATMIARLANELNADLIAMATHGRGGLTRVVLGGVASEVLRRATVPLLLTRPLPVGQPTDQPVPAPSEKTAELRPRLLTLALTPEEFELVIRSLQRLRSSEYPAEPIEQLLTRLGRMGPVAT